MVSNLATEANDSSKSIISSWLYPCVTSLTLFLIMIPDLSNLFLNTHLALIIEWVLGLGTKVQTWFQID